MCFPHGFSLQFNLVDVVHQAIQDRISDCGIADILAPEIYRQLSAHDGGSQIMPAFYDDQEQLKVWLR